MNEVPIRPDVFEFLIGKEVTIDYRDKNGHASQRIIIPRTRTSVYGYPAIRAFCTLRNEERTFLFNRISKCLSEHWDENDFNNHLKQIAESKRNELRRSVFTARKSIFVATILIILSFGGCRYAANNITPHSVDVSGYTRSDGMDISSHHRRPPGSTSRDAPYETLAFLSFLIFAGSALVIWYSAYRLRELKNEIRST